MNYLTEQERAIEQAAIRRLSTECPSTKSRTHHWRPVKDTQRILTVRNGISHGTEEVKCSKCSQVESGIPYQQTRLI